MPRSTAMKKKKKSVFSSKSSSPNERPNGFNKTLLKELSRKTLESILDCKEIKQVNPKGNQSRIFIRRTDAEAETPILWPLDAKN